MRSNAVGAEALDVVEFVDDALPIAAVILLGILCIDVDVVALVAVVEPVGDDVIDHLAIPAEHV